MCKFQYLFHIMEYSLYGTFIFMDFLCLLTVGGFSFFVDIFFLFFQLKNMILGNYFNFLLFFFSKTEHQQKTLKYSGDKWNVLWNKYDFESQWRTKKKATYKSIRYTKLSPSSVFVFCYISYIHVVIFNSKHLNSSLFVFAATYRCQNWNFSFAFCFLSLVHVNKPEAERTYLITNKV